MALQFEEYVKQLGRKAFETGTVKAPAQDIAMVRFLEKNKLQVGEGVTYLKLWNEGFQAALNEQLAKDFPEMYPAAQA